jgi:hypothetical protein
MYLLKPDLLRFRNSPLGIFAKSYATTEFGAALNKPGPGLPVKARMQSLEIAKLEIAACSAPAPLLRRLTPRGSMQCATSHMEFAATFVSNARKLRRILR